MTDLEQNEIVESHGEHYRFISLEETEDEADKVVELILDSGHKASKLLKDNKKWEVFQKFSPAEECMWILEQKCKVCSNKETDKCNSDECKVKADIEDVIWKDQRNFYTLIQYKLKKLQAAQKT